MTRLMAGRRGGTGIVPSGVNSSSTPLAALETSGPEFGMAQVAEQAGVTRPVVYRHFADRASLVEAMADRMATRIMSRLMPAVYDVDGAVMDRIRCSVDALVAAVEDVPQSYLFFLRRGALGGPDIVGQGTSYVAAALAALFDEFFCAHGLDEPEEAALLAVGIVGHVQSVVEWWLGHPAVPRARVTEFVSASLCAQMAESGRRVGVEFDPALPVGQQNPGPAARR